MAEIGGFNGLSNITTFVNQFLEIERRPIQNLATKKSDIQKLVAVFTDLKSNLSVLRKRVKGFLAFGAENKLGTNLAVSSNESIVKAEATSFAQNGINTIFVSRIASRDTALSGTFSKTLSSIASQFRNTTQRFTIQIGDNTPVEIATSFDDGSEKNPNVLNRIAESINNSGLEVSASVVEVNKSSARLAIISNETGSSNAITFANVSDSELLDQLGLPEGSGNRSEAEQNQGGFLKENAEELDALFTLNGVEITQGSNKVTGAISGLTINLLKAQDENDHSCLARP